MQRETLERLLRRRFALPLLLAGVALFMLANEITYQRTVHALSGGISLTDARIATARVLQLLTDAETGQRGYLLTGRAEYLDPLEKAKAELPQQTRAVTAFFESAGQTRLADPSKILEEIAAKLAELDQTIALWAAGDRSSALRLVDSGAGEGHMDHLRSVFAAKLAEAASLQQEARGFIYRALGFQRALVAALSGVIMMGLYLHLLQLRRFDRELAGRQQTLETQVLERTIALRTLAGYLQSVREDERSRLARELHDELGGVLTAGKLSLARLRSRIHNDPSLLELIEQISRRLSEGIALKRKIIEDLRPSALTTLGLTTALAILTREASEQLGVPVHAEIADVKLSPEAELSLYRLVQEALTNIGKYAQASEVWVRLKREAGALQVEVADNGKGFETANLQVGNHGLAGMRFRIESLGGTLSVVSSVGKGTTISATLPEQAQQAAPAGLEQNPLALTREAGVLPGL